MPTPTFFALPAERRERLVREAISEFSERSYAEASLSQIALRARIAKGSFYQYFADKLDLYRWLLTRGSAAPASASSSGSPTPSKTFGRASRRLIERGMAFLVEHPRLARLTAAAADPVGDRRGTWSARGDLRGRYRRAARLARSGIAARRYSRARLGHRSRHALGLRDRWSGSHRRRAARARRGAPRGARLDSLRKQLGPARRRRLAHQAVLLIRGGLGAAVRPNQTKEGADDDLTTISRTKSRSSPVARQASVWPTASAFATRRSPRVLAARSEAAGHAACER